MRKKHTKKKGHVPFATFGNPGPSVGGSGTFGNLIDSLKKQDLSGQKHEQSEHYPGKKWGVR